MHPEKKITIAWTQTYNEIKCNRVLQICQQQASEEKNTVQDNG